MLSERLPEIGQAVDVQSLDRLGNAAMHVPPAPRWELVVGDFADPMVGEIEAVSGGGEEPTSDQLFHALGRRHLLQTRRAAQELELELATDRRRDTQQRAA